jgi:hypothetical protein
MTRCTWLMISVLMKLSFRRSSEKTWKVQTSSHPELLPILKNIRTFKLLMTRIPWAIQLLPVSIRTKSSHLNLEILKAILLWGE